MAGTNVCVCACACVCGGHEGVQTAVCMFVCVSLCVRERERERERERNNVLVFPCSTPHCTFFLISSLYKYSLCSSLSLPLSFTPSFTHIYSVTSYILTLFSFFIPSLPLHIPFLQPTFMLSSISHTIDVVPLNRSAGCDPGDGGRRT